MINYKELCEKTCIVAKQAGEFIKKERVNFSPGRIETKSAENDLVSYVDKEAEIIIVHALRDLVKGAGFITEEKTTDNCVDAEYCWVIDPLDGTTNFAHALAPYCVSIALLENRVPVVGVVYEITADECFYAWKDSAAYLNGREIRVSETKLLTKSLIATGFSYGSDSRHEEFHHQNEYLMRHTHGFRRIGSAAADLAYIAAGRFDGFAQFNLQSWDVAAGALIALRAGAVVSDYSAGDDYIFGKEIIASNPHIYNDYKMLISSTK